MKRWFTAVLIFFILLVVSTYFFIPATLNISKVTIINIPKNAASRFLLDESKWKNWWPGTTSSGNIPPGKTFYYNDYSYLITEFFTDKIRLLTIKDDDTLHTFINILPTDKNSLSLQWECNVKTDINPLKRIQRYLDARAIRNNMASIFRSLQAFLEKNSNVYGYPIAEIISKDSTLIATKYITKAYPRMDEVYRLIDSMKIYISKQGALETNHPMLRISKMNDSVYQTMIAIPTNKKLEGNGAFFLQLFVPWKTLTGSVKGGIYTVDQAFKQMQSYVEDYQRTSMAVPFQILVTDRRSETDTLKWVTLICQPVS